MPSTYVLPSSRSELRHHQARVWSFGDHAEHRDPELDALARSGDFFVTLATKLENTAAELPEITPAASSLALSKLAQELEYMQRHYEIVRKPAPDSDRSSI